MKVTKSNVNDVYENLNEYFIQKLLKGEYSIIQHGTHTVSLIIDNKFLFHLWTATGRANFGCSAVQPSALQLTFNDVEQSMLYAQFTDK